MPKKQRMEPLIKENEEIILKIYLIYARTK
jgi:hypothetical protein